MPPSKSDLSKRIILAEHAVITRFINRIFEEIALMPPERADHIVTALKEDFDRLDEWRCRSADLGDVIDCIYQHVQAIDAELADKVRVRS